MPTLEEKIRALPDEPGVYQYFDAQGRLLYIGKAKSLKKRVKSYFRFTPFSPAPNLPPRIFKMISETVDMDFIRVESENDALILENSLIKQLKPKYNILLRDDKTYPYIYIDFNEPFPRPRITRKVIQGRRVKYFGPFPSAARDILDSIYETFPLVQKEGCLRSKKACLFHQIKKCLAPCEGRVSEEEYAAILDEAISHIHDKRKLISKLRARMEQYATQLRFEEAAQIRDRIKRIESIETASGIDLAKMENFDVYAIATAASHAVVVRMFMREGRVIASSSSKIRFDPQRGFDMDEAYKRTLLEFYTHETPLTSTKILVAHDFAEREDLEKLLSEKFGKKISILHPKRGQKVRLTELALLNAGELLQKAPQEPMALRLKELLGLENAPYRIEVFDNSHISGSVPVGAMVVWEEDRFDKGSYRHYNLHAKDEYAQMRELLTRRCESFDKNPPPEMWLIDGGETLRELAREIAASFGVHIDVVAIAKEKIDAKAHRAKGKAKDTIYAPHGALRLAPDDPRLLFLQRLRDEAHRFALSFHQKQRTRRAREIELLKVKGIKEAKAAKLLNYFGTFEAIRQADVEEIAKVLGKKEAIMLKKVYN